MRRHALRPVPYYRETIIALLALALLASASVLVPSLARSAAGPLTGTSYDSVSAGTDNYSGWDEQVKASNRVTYVSDPAGQRGVVQRVEVQPGDNNVAGSGSGERAEVLKVSNPSLAEFVDGQTIVMSWGTYIDSGFSSPTGGWNNFVQTHGSGGGMQTPWQLNLSGDAAELKMRLYGGGTWVNGSQPAGSVNEWFSLGPLPKNQWSDFVVEVRFGCTGTGYAKVWRNGTLLVDAQNRKIGYCGDPGHYWKQGFYRAAYDKTTRLWFDDTFRWASTTDAFAHYGWSGGSPSTAPAPSLPTAPAITQAPASSTTSTSASFAFASSTSGVTYECALDGAAFAGCTSPKSYSGLSVATHAFQVRAVNSAGASSAASHSWQILTSASEPAPAPTPAPEPAPAPAPAPAPSEPFGVTQNVTDGQELPAGYEWVATPSGREVTRVAFLVDGQLVKTERTAPYRVVLDPASIRPGQRTFTVTAFATDGTTATSSAKARAVKSQEPAPKKSSDGGNAAPSSPSAETVTVQPASPGTPATKPVGPTAPAAPASPTVESGPTDTQTAGTKVSWGGKSFTRAGDLRGHLIDRGVDWNVFVATHPSVVETFDLRSVTWDGKRFFTQRALKEYLAEQGKSYGRWAATHPVAAALLSGRPAG